MQYILIVPDLKRVRIDQVSKAITGPENKEILKYIKRMTSSEHLYWDTFRYKEPSPEGYSKEELWFIIKYIRETQSVRTSIKDKNSGYFSWIKLDYFEQLFHELDMNTGGELFVEKGGFNKANKQKLIMRGIMEEAIASSQLEGAATSRQAAKKMLREGRKPVNKSEQMIVNSYASMKAIEESYKDKAMSMDLLMELHGLITKDTHDSADEKPRMRKDGEPVCVTDETNGLVYHQGPETEFVKKELDKLIKFANDESESDGFVHPVIKGIMLHFWMGYLHPFTDGNGRLARMLFYWYLIKKGYWAFVYLPISKIIKRSPKQYIMAYVYSEQDDNDLTYFIDYNLKKIQLALKEFSEYVKKQSANNIQMKKKCEARYHLNLRQVQLLQYLNNEPDERTTLTIHMNINQIAKMTAITDLRGLIEKGFLRHEKIGRNVFYYATEKVKELF
ncbi:MAG: Fic family protein [Candidatus Margulisiibacteriota bacterium]